MPSGDVALFIATPGQSNIQPRIDGAQDTSRSRSRHQDARHHHGRGAAGGAVGDRLLRAGHPDTKGYFAVDAGSTQGLAQTIQKHKLRNKGVKGGGYDLTPVTQKLLADDQIDFTIDQQPYLQGFLPDPAAVPVQGVAGAVGHRRHQHRPEVPRQDDGRPLQQHQEPLRGHLVLARRGQGLGLEPSTHERRRTGDDARASAPPARAASPGPRGPGRASCARFLTLREGSIIVVTLLTILYFSLQNDRFFTHANFETLLPYFAPFAILAVGEVMLMVAGEIDLSIGSV